MDDQRLGSAVGEQVGELLAAEMPVHRHRIGAEPPSGPSDLEHGEIVAQHPCDRIARAHAERREAAGCAGDAVFKLRPAESASTAQDGGFHALSYPLPVSSRRDLWRSGGA